MSRVAWVIGANGLLGSAVRRSIRARSDWSVVDRASLPWADLHALREAARASATDLIRHAEAAGDEWVVIWAGGSVVTSSSSEAVAAELVQFTTVIDEIANAAGSTTTHGTFFYASSAGGVYAGSASPPFNEQTPVAPLSHYGQFKLDSEAAAEQMLVAAGIPTVAGRISNLYGPGQRLEKPQGLISHLARAQFTPTPVSIYVSLDTLRDYLYVYDCAELILDAVERSRAEHLPDSPVMTVKNLISGRAITISGLLGIFRGIVKAHPHVMLGSSSSAALQAFDLRLESVVWPELDRRMFTTLDTGISATLQDVLGRIQSPRGR